MQLISILTLCVLACQVMSQGPGLFVPDPNDPNILRPVRLDETRPNIRVQPYEVDQPTESILPLIGLMLLVPYFLLRQTGSSTTSPGTLIPGSGGITIIREPVCC
ncbi:uncharacterized protein LOC127834517 [Dreissena polymorpha]|uniref:Uncharacterized protein n=1 Tax=Dreissena polymorpha TaxID=45954 RepID=A0A9D4G3D5_DREPO|nr:uncharacterized protein LOC127834517 [Dreissena polymorpha]KAH3808379.1 hypothetical protein DPMN_136732 [Dreissena polymorpha]